MKSLIALCTLFILASIFTSWLQGDMFYSPADWAIVALFTLPILLIGASRES